MYLPFQELKPGRMVLSDEAWLDSYMETFRKKQKLERVASYRQLQGISHQVDLVSNGRDDIDCFVLPPEAHVRAVGESEERCTSTSMPHHSFIRNKFTKEKLRVLPPDLHDCKLLLLQLDQGSIGAAGVAFAEYGDGRMITAKFDKIHRMIRDIKGAAQSVPIFQKAKLWSAYLFSLNKRPFGKGAHGSAKQRMMEVFARTTTVSSYVFVKHLPRLSKRNLGQP